MPIGGAGIDHSGDGVMPEILLVERALAAPSSPASSMHAIGRMAAADPCRLHAARGRKVRRAKAHAVHARTGGGDVVDVLDALRGFQNGMNQDRLFDAVAAASSCASN